MRTDGCGGIRRPHLVDGGQSVTCPSSNPTTSQAIGNGQQAINGQSVYLIFIIAIGQAIGNGQQAINRQSVYLIFIIAIGYNTMSPSI